VLHLKIPHNHTKYRGEKNNVIKTEKCFKIGKKDYIIKNEKKRNVSKERKKCFDILEVYGLRQMP
jgi:hypothetical protein